ncbi:MAG: hypothetical protein ABFE16_16035 [Armatimonadia bacterium]
MTETVACLLLVACLGLCANVAVAAPAVASPAADYTTRLLSCVSGIAADLPAITAVADKAAARLVAGGTLWLAGSHRGFIQEAYVRAGGMMRVKTLAGHVAELAPKDVVLVGTLSAESSADQTLLRDASKAGALVILLAPRNVEGTHLYVSPHAAEPGEEGVLPVASPALAAAFWTLTGELVGSLTRLGKMPPMYESVVVPGGRERNKSHLTLDWEPGTVTPLRPGLLGRRYLERLATCMRRLRKTQMEGFAEAGRMAAEALAQGHKAWYVGVGHMPPYEVGQKGDTGLLAPLDSPNTKPEPVAGKIQAGDVLLYVGYYEPFGPWVETAHAQGARIVTLVSGTPERPAKDMGADLNLDACWPFGDALVDIRGYDVRILPPSGVMQSAAYWMLQAETRRFVR